MPWQSLQLTPPPALATLTQGFSAGVNVLKGALQLVVAQAHAYSTFLRINEGAPVDAASAALQAGLLAATNLLNGVLDDTGAYVLLIPIPKKGLVGVVSSPDMPSEPGSNFVQFPTTGVLSQLSAATADRLRTSPSFATLFSEGSVAIGGNPYVVKTVGESLYDLGDRNRPKFTNDSYWAYTLLMTGANDLSTVIRAAQLFDRLFVKGNASGAVGASKSVANVVPSGLRVGPSGRGTFAVLEWETVPASRILESYDRARVTATEYAIIASTDFRAKTASSVLDLFGTSNLTAGLTGLYGSRVLAVTPYDGVVSRYLDERTFEQGSTVYYHIAFKTRIENDPPTASTQAPPPQDRRPGVPRSATNEPVQLPYGPLSSCAEYRVRKATDARLSKAPDWIRSPSLAQLIPGVDSVVDRVNERLTELRRISARGSEINGALLRALERQVSRLETQIAELTQLLNRVNDTLSGAPPGVFATTRSGSGSVGAFLTDIATALDDTSDSNRPPFDSGDEFVVGALILAVGPNAAGVAAAFDSLLALFGPPDTTGALAGINSVTASLTDVETALVDSITGGGTSTPSSPVAFGEDMSSRPVGSPDASCE